MSTQLLIEYFCVNTGCWATWWNTLEPYLWQGDPDPYHTRCPKCGMPGRRRTKFTDPDQNVPKGTQGIICMSCVCLIRVGIMEDWQDFTWELPGEAVLERMEGKACPGCGSTKGFRVLQEKDLANY